MELTYRVYDAINGRDLDAFLELMHVYAGHAGIRQWWADLLDVLPDFAVEVVEVRDGKWLLD